MERRFVCIHSQILHYIIRFSDVEYICAFFLIYTTRLSMQYEQFYMFSFLSRILNDYQLFAYIGIVIKDWCSSHFRIKSMAVTFNSKINSSNSSTAPPHSTTNTSSAPAPHQFHRLRCCPACSIPQCPRERPSRRTSWSTAAFSNRTGSPQVSRATPARRRVLRVTQRIARAPTAQPAPLPPPRIARAPRAIRRDHSVIHCWDSASRHIHSLDPDKLSSELFVRVRPESVQLLLAGGRQAGIKTKHVCDSAAKAFIINLAK